MIISNYITFHDISYAQGLYDMDSDPSPVVEMKMTGYYYGSVLGYTDAQAVHNYDDAVRTGKVPILYHYAGGGDPVAEADYFVDNGAMPFALGDIYELDYELTDRMNPPADPDAWCRTYADRVKERTGAYPLFYTNTSIFLGHAGFPKTMEVCALIIADYRYTPDEDVPCGHPYIIHQFTDTPLDTNALFIDLETLKKYGYGYEPPVQEVPPVVTPTPMPTPDPAPTPPPAPTPQPTDPPVGEPSADPPASPPPITPAPSPAPTPQPTLYSYLAQLVASVVAWLKSWRRS